MNILSFTYLAVGRNRLTLFLRMKREGIALLKLRIIDEKRAEITVSAKDRAKYFAICENICYNTLIRTSGIIAPFYKIIRRPSVILIALVFCVIVYFGSNIYLKSEYIGQSVDYVVPIENALENAGVKRFSIFNESQLNTAEKTLDELTDATFIKIEKSGNRAIITTFWGEKKPQKAESSDTDIVATSDCKVVKISAYSGTPLVKEGDEVVKGQPIIGAYRVMKDCTKSPCKITGYVLTEERFTYRYEGKFIADEQAKARALSVARFALGEYTITNSLIKTEGKDIIVTLYYERVLFGNEFFGG